MPDVSARILPPTPENISLAAEALLRGDVVGMPTETVYGLAGLAFDEDALAKIFRVKDRPTFDPLIVHVAAPAREPQPPAFDWLALLVGLQLIDHQRLGAGAQRQVHNLSRLWPGPLTLVLRKHSRVPDLATSGLLTVAIRSPRHPVAQALLREVGQPLAAPSANRFGRISSTCAVDVAAELGDRIDLILDGGPCDVGLESTVVAVDENGHVTLLRPGAISREMLQECVTQRVETRAQCGIIDPAEAQVSPGRLASHYAPVKPLYLLPAAVAELTDEHCASLAKLLAGRSRLGLLLYSDCRVGLNELFGGDGVAPLIVRALSESGDDTEAARNLFRCLRELDADPNVDVILAEPVPDPTGLGYAIADRLRRASRTL